MRFKVRLKYSDAAGTRMASGSPFQTGDAAEEKQHAAVLVCDLGTVSKPN